MINMIELERAFNAMRPVVAGWFPHWIYPSMQEWVTNGGTANAPLTSTSWDGDSYSTTAKTLIDLSAVFGVPAGVKAVYVKTAIRDSGSAAADCILYLSCESQNNLGPSTDCKRITNDVYVRDMLIVPCDANGDIYYQIVASGAGTFDVIMQVWGYYI